MKSKFGDRTSPDDSRAAGRGGRWAGHGFAEVNAIMPAPSSRRRRGSETFFWPFFCGVLTGWETGARPQIRSGQLELIHPMLASAHETFRTSQPKNVLAPRSPERLSPQQPKKFFSRLPSPSRAFFAFDIRSACGHAVLKSGLNMTRSRGPPPPMSSGLVCAAVQLSQLCVLLPAQP